MLLTTLKWESLLRQSKDWHLPPDFASDVRAIYAAEIFTLLSPALMAGIEAGHLNIKDMEKVECEYCGGLFLVAQAVVLNEKGEFHYYCSKDCAMKRRAPGSRKTETGPEMELKP